MTSVSGPRVDPAPLFDLVTGFPPDDAVDVTVPMPLSLGISMTMLESTGHAADLAVLRKIQIHEARETTRGIQAWVGDLIGPQAAASARLRLTHIVEERVPRMNGLRPHVHAYVGATVRDPIDGRELPVDLERLAVLAASDLFPDYCDRLATATAERPRSGVGGDVVVVARGRGPALAGRAHRGLGARRPDLPRPLAPAPDPGRATPFPEGVTRG
jgi:hypothetical protein